MTSPVKEFLERFLSHAAEIDQDDMYSAEPPPATTTKTQEVASQLAVPQEDQSPANEQTVRPAEGFFERLTSVTQEDSYTVEEPPASDSTQKANQAKIICHVFHPEGLPHDQVKKVSVVMSGMDTDQDENAMRAKAHHEEAADKGSTDHVTVSLGQNWAHKNLLTSVADAVDAAKLYLGWETAGSRAKGKEIVRLLDEYPNADFHIEAHSKGNLVFTAAIKGLKSRGEITPAQFARIKDATSYGSPCDIQLGTGIPTTNYVGTWDAVPVLNLDPRKMVSQLIRTFPSDSPDGLPDQAMEDLAETRRPPNEAVVESGHKFIDYVKASDLD